MGPKTKKLTKKQQQELLEKQKQEAKEQKLRELERKKQEEERQKKIEDKRRKILEDIEKHENENLQLKNEEEKLNPNKDILEKKLTDKLDKINKYNNWIKYSNCLPGFLDIRNEHEITSFLYNFEERMSIPLYNNYQIVKRDINEELEYLGNVSNYIEDFTKLLIESKAIDNIKNINYSFKYILITSNYINLKIESLTKFLLENFDLILNSFKEDNSNSLKINNNTNNNPYRIIYYKEEVYVEWLPFKNNNVVELGYWINYVKSNRDVKNGRFSSLPVDFKFPPSQCFNEKCVIRFVHYNLDDKFFTDFNINYIFNNSFSINNNIIDKYNKERYYKVLYNTKSDIVDICGLNNDLEDNTYFPYISINGIFKLNFIDFPSNTIEYNNWKIKEITPDSYLKQLKKDVGVEVKMHIITNLSKEIYSKDLINSIPVYFGKLNSTTNEWNLDLNNPIKYENERGIQERSLVYELYNELGTFSLFIEKKHLIPYKSWYLRSVFEGKEVYNFDTNKYEFRNLFIARIDIETIRLKLHFEIDESCIKLINCIEKELEHLNNKPFKFEELLYKLRLSGIYLTPTDKDIEFCGNKTKSTKAVNNAINDIAYLIRKFAIKSHDLNKQLTNDIITVKVKPNPENDNYFYDDEPKDWSEIGWYDNKVEFGTAKEVKFKDDLLDDQLLEDFTDDQLQKKIDFISDEYNKPRRNIIGLLEDNEKFNKYAEEVSRGDNQLGTIINLISFLRITKLCHMP